MVHSMSAASHTKEERKAHRIDSDHLPIPKLVRALGEQQINKQEDLRNKDIMKGKNTTCPLYPISGPSFGDEQSSL